jgi:hypothetical protein
VIARPLTWMLTTGKIAVTTKGGGATSTTSFTVN